MATSYTGLRVQDTYNAIIKIGDNSNLTATPKLLSDGLGNDSPLYLSGTRLGIGISPAYQFHTSGNAKIGGNLIISGNLTVNGTLTYLNVEDLAVEDPLIKLAKDNASNTLDIGFFGKYVESSTTKYTGLFWDASTDKFRLFEGLQVEPTTTVDPTGTGYTRSLLNADLEGNVTGTVSSLSNHDTNDLVEGSVNLYYTNARADARVNLQTGANLDLSSKDTDDLGEGTTNLYFTTARARASFTEGTGVTITNGEIAIGQDVSTTSNVTFGNITGSAISGTTGTFSGQVTIPETPTADAHAASKKYVDDNTGTSDVAKRLEVTVKNVSGASLAKGTVVHAAPTATPPSGNVIEVIAADANDAAKMPAIGVLNETIADEVEGEAVMFGAVSGIDTSSFSIGDELYVSETAGEFTATKPTAFGSQVQKVAVVIKSHASNGLIKVFGAGRANDVPNRVDRDMNFTDDSVLSFGTGEDIKIYHNSTSTNANIENHNGSLYITNYADDEDIVFRTDNGSGDVIEYFRLDGSTNTIPFGRSPHIIDNLKLYFGNDTANDASIKWDSTASELFIDGNSKFLDDLSVVGDLDISGNVTTGRNISLSSADYCYITGDHTDGGDGDWLMRMMGYVGSTYYGSFDILKTDADDGELRLRQRIGGTATDVLTISRGNLTTDGISTNSGEINFLGFEDGDGFTIPRDQDTGYSNIGWGAGGVLFRGSYDSYLLGNLYYYKTDGTSQWRLKYPSYGATCIASGDGKYTFYTAASNSTSPHNVSLSARMVLTQTGELGIGTDNPQKQLEVVGDLQLDATNANMWIKSGGAGTNGFINWTFNTDSTVYIKTGIDYDTRATLGYHIDSGYPITIDCTNQIDFKRSGDVLGRWNSTGLGIGTTSPSTKLHTVQATENWIYVETSGTDAIAGLRTSTSTGSRQNTLYRNVTTNLLTLRAGTDDGEIQFIAGGSTSERMRIDSSGNVGIADSSPAYKLDINETGTSTYVLHAQKSGTSLGGLYVDGSSNAEFYLKASGNSTQILLNTDGNSYFNGGNLGIGDSSPDAKLDVELAATNTYSGTALNTPNIIVSNRNSSNVNSQAAIISLRPTGWEGITTGVVNIGAVQAGNANSAHFVVQTRNGGTYGERMRIDSSGVVQVRNQTPTIQLYNTDNGLANNQTLGDIDWYQIDPSDQGVGTVAKIRAINTSTFSGSADLTFQTGNATSITERMRITSLGNVGIGVTPFAHSLGTSVNIDLLGNGGIWGYAGATYVNSNAYYDSGWKYKSTAPAAVLQVGGGSPTLTFRHVGSGSAGDAITFSQPFTIDANGNMGLGVTSATARLDIKTNSVTGDNSIDRHVRFRADNGEERFNFFVGRSGNSPTLSMYDSSEVLRTVIGTAGDSYFNGVNLGIGTTNPSNKLHVVQGTSDWETAEFQSSHTVGCGITLVGANTGVQWSLVANAQGGAGNNNLGFHLTNNGTSSDSTGYKMIIDSNGYVGIGTQPSHKLHLKQNSAANLINLIEQDNASYEAWYEAKSQNSGYARFGISNDANAYAFFNTSVTSYNWYHTGGGLLMTLNSNGHLGLGITNLTFAKLAVNGAVYSSAGTFNAGTDTVTDAAFVLDEGDYIYTRDSAQYARKLIGKNTSDIITIGESGTTLIDGINFYSGYDGANYKWYRNTSVAMQLYGSGSQPYEVLDVKGRIYAETDNGSQALISRTLAINYQGASGSVDIDPVALFGANKRGGYLLLEVNGWQTRFNAGYIHWHNNGGTGAIGTGSVTYRQTAWSGSASGAGVTVSTISSSTNVIRISFSGWHTNAHGWKASIIWRG